MIPEIDFLPASYREVRRRHRNRIWRRSIVVIFLTLVTLSTVRQREIQHELQSKKETLEKHIQQMHEQLQDPAQLTQQIELSDLRADLLAGLLLDESPAQLLAITSHSLPEYVSLNEFQFLFEKVAGKEKPTNVKQKKAPEKVVPEKLDLEKLKQHRTDEQLVLLVQGIAPDHLSISDYMSNLDRLGVFKAIDLIQSNETMFEGETMRQFRLRIVVKAPGMFLPPLDHRLTAGLDHPLTGGYGHE